MTVTELDRWLLVCVETNVVRLRRVVDASVVYEIALSDGAHVDSVRVSQFAPMGATIDRSRNQMAFLWFAEKRSQWQPLPEAAKISIIEVAGDGLAVACENEDLDQTFVAQGRPAPFKTGRTFSALAAEAQGFVVVNARSPAHGELRRLRRDSEGRVEEYGGFTFEPGQPYPVLLGLAPVGESEFVTQVVEEHGPPWIVLIAPDRTPRRITRSWFGRDQAIVRNGVLLHFPGFGDRTLHRLELTEGAVATPVFGEAGPRVVSLSPDGGFALTQTGESEVLEGGRVGLVSHVRDVTTGEVLVRLVLDAGEMVSDWMTQV